MAAHDPWRKFQTKLYIWRMHHFPPLAALQVFVGDAIAQISLDPYGVQFAFESMRHIALEERLEHREANGTIWVYNCEAATGSPTVLHRLLLKRIALVNREDLSLTFAMEDGSSLTLFSVIGPYESGQIAMPPSTLFVF